MNIYKDPLAPIEARIEDLLGQMTLEEKLAQLHAMWLFLSEDGEHRPREDKFTGEGNAAGLKEQLRLGLGQITRPLGTASRDPLSGVRALNALQKFMMEDTRLGIPVLSHEECLSGLMARGATLFPSSLGYGATWNPDLIEKVSAAIGREMMSVGGRQGLAPVLDVARDARWGRTEETFGEDPYIAGIMATKYVQGLQGKDRQILATLKHYVGHSYSEGARNHAPVHLGWRELNDDFMLPFEMAVKLGNAASVMPAYHDIDNEPVHASRHLLTKVLREEWGFDGIIVADYIGVTLLYAHHGVASDAAEAAALSFGAGLDVELPGDDCAPSLKAALERGLIDMATIDEAVRRGLREKFRLGLFERPYTDEGGIALRTKEAVELALEVAEQSVTILDNNGILPLAKDKRVAVIGATADDPLALLGDYAFPVHVINHDQVEDSSSVVTLLDGFKEALGADRVSFAKGCYILESRSSGAPVFPGDVEDNTTLKLESPLSKRLDLIPEAVAAAKEADVAIVCVGDLSGIFQTGTVGEGSDAETLELPGVQQKLLDAIVDTGTPVIVVLTNGRPYNLGGREKDLAAQVMAYFPGEQGGRAVARVMTGAVEPSGRSTLSIPRSAGAVPYFYNHKFKSPGTPVARHFGSDYAFGHGLSYTTFEFSDLRFDSDVLDIESGTVSARFKVKNIGGRKGIAVPQLYVRDKLASLVRPIKELKGFARVALEAGASAEVTIDVPVDMLNFTGYEGKRIVEPGEFEIMIGHSSADIALRGTITVTGKVRTLGQDWRMLSEATIQKL